MKIIIAILLSVSTVFGLIDSVSAATTISTISTTITSIQKAKTILVLGDSISAAYGLSQAQGWVALTATQLSASKNPKHAAYRIQNASLSGDTTAGGAQRLPALLKQYQPDIVLIELGGNDALRGLPLEQTEGNFKQMITAIKRAKAQVLLLPMQIPPNYGSRYTKAFNGLYGQLSKTHNVAITPFIFKDFAENMVYFQTDRIHPTSAAQPLIVATVWSSLENMLTISNKVKP